MSDIQLFRLHGNCAVTELTCQAGPLEKTLQALINGQPEIFLGFRFLAGEYETGKKHSGRINSLGLALQRANCRRHDRTDQRPLHYDRSAASTNFSRYLYHRDQSHG